MIPAPQLPIRLSSHQHHVHPHCGQDPKHRSDFELKREENIVVVTDGPLEGGIAEVPVCMQVDPVASLDDVEAVIGMATAQVVSGNQVQ